MQITFVQILLLTIYAFVAIYDALETDIGLSRPIQAGFFTGLIMGNVTLGLAVGATLQLMILGVGTYGGASIPDFMTGAIIGTAFGVISGQGIEFAIGLAVPIGLLLVQLDVLARFANTFFQHRADKYAEEGNFKKVETMNILGIIPWGLSRAIPVFVALLFGHEIVEQLVKVFPSWLTSGLSVAGKVLPALGIAILLRYLPVKKYSSYLLIGFVLAAYLKVPMVGVAIVGMALGLLVYQRNQKDVRSALTGGANEDE
ncbi:MULTISPECIES: PTS mannose/fructose/sorbose/N-acetylgalactosamine transporter subunit IIC [Tissierellales]|jgi:PTS system mannose-specific IIC component|uniref:PTS sugar transporter subunit IIC n=1 Tax=Acidilutibacter cellobiosedens TaxID=2507161 RepID=A0A410QFW4_9FIRM|nr:MULTISPECIES: PTS sugar transporter subunit IIC [Tissierellales]MBE6083097.1 PTS sugar transporter subunit IIC [Tissierellaceae bacterium]QAT62815.1 PTS sugar transporter subunit IIC [Acidilutibacter cellobiosedens]SCL93216.1 PTS system N-acetylgalactosamine-specific EIIC component 1 [Sporanaerobacter sp. PP17-6a]